MSRLSLVAGLLEVGLLGSEAAARGRFDVPEHCGTEGMFEQRVREHLGVDARALLDAMDLGITEISRGYRLTLQIGEHSRSIEDPRCEDLLLAGVVVAITLWEGPNSAPSEVLAPAASVPASNTATGTSPVAPSGIDVELHRESSLHGPTGHLTLRQSPRRSSLHWMFSGEAGLGTGLQPRTGPLFGLRAALDAPMLGAAVTLRYLPTNSTRDQNQRGVEVTAVGGKVAGYVKPISMLAIEAGLSSYYVRGRGLGSSEVASASVVSFGPHLAVHAKPWQGKAAFVDVGVEAQLELLRPRFEILEYGQVFRSGPIALAGFFRVGYRFD